MPTVRIKQVPPGQPQQVVPGVPYIAQHIKAAEKGMGTIEAEGGETILGDVNRDGMLEHMKISGPSHAQGGVELDVDPGAFIFSDATRLRIKDPEVLAHFTKTVGKGKKGLTPAQIAKQYDVNTYINTLKQENPDAFAAQTAQYMLDQNTKKLAELSMVQEGMKGFPSGIPQVAQQLVPQEQQMKLGGLVQYQGGGKTRAKGEVPQMQVAPADTAMAQIMADNRADMNYGNPLVQVPEEIPTIAPDNATGYFDRVRQKQTRRDPRSQQALEKMVPFYGAESDGLLDYVSNVFMAPQYEVNHLMTGYYESPMTTAARYNELSRSTRVLGDIATDPLIVGDLAAKGVFSGGKYAVGKVAEYAPALAEKSVALAKGAGELASRYGAKVAEKLAPYIGKIPTGKLALIAGRLSQGMSHLNAGDEPLSVDQLNQLGAPQSIYDFLTKSGKRSTASSDDLVSTYNWSKMFGNIPDPVTNLPEVQITGNKQDLEAQYADILLNTRQEEALREASDALYGDGALAGEDDVKHSVQKKAPSQVVTTQPRRIAPVQPIAPVRKAVVAPVATNSSTNAAQAAFDLDD